MSTLTLLDTLRRTTPRSRTRLGDITNVAVQNGGRSSPNTKNKKPHHHVLPITIAPVDEQPPPAIRSPRKFTFEDRIVQGAIRDVELKLQDSNINLAVAQTALKATSGERDALRSELCDARDTIVYITRELSHERNGKNLDTLATVSTAGSYLDQRLSGLVKTAQVELLKLELENKNTEIVECKAQLAAATIPTPAPIPTPSPPVNIEPRLAALQLAQTKHNLTAPHLCLYIDCLIEMSHFIQSHLDKTTHRPSRIVYNIFDPSVVAPPRSDLNKVNGCTGIDDVEQLCTFLIRLHDLGNQIRACEKNSSAAVMVASGLNDCKLAAAIDPQQCLGFQDELELRLSSVVRYHLRHALDATTISSPIFLILNTTRANTSWSDEALQETPSEAVAAFFHRALTVIAHAGRDSSQRCGAASSSCSSSTSTTNEVQLLGFNANQVDPKAIKAARTYAERMLDVIRRMEPLDANRANSWRTAQRWASKGIELCRHGEIDGGLELLANIKDLTVMLEQQSLSVVDHNSTTVMDLRGARRTKMLAMKSSGWKTAAAGVLGMMTTSAANNNKAGLFVSYPEIRFVLD